MCVMVKFGVCNELTLVVWIVRVFLPQGSNAFAKERCISLLGRLTHDEDLV